MGCGLSQIPGGHLPATQPEGSSSARASGAAMISQNQDGVKINVYALLKFRAAQRRGEPSAGNSVWVTSATPFSPLSSDSPSNSAGDTSIALHGTLIKICLSSAPPFFPTAATDIVARAAFEGAAPKARAPLDDQGKQVTHFFHQARSQSDDITTLSLDRTLILGEAPVRGSCTGPSLIIDKFRRPNSDQ